MDGKDLTYCRSRDIDVPFRVKICYLEGERPRIPYSQVVEDPEKAMTASNISPVSDLVATVQLFSDSKPLTIPVSTLYKPFRNGRRWNEWVSLPIKLSQLPLNSQLAITVWDFAGGRTMVPYGGTTVRLFNAADCTLKGGRQKLKVWLDKEADGLNDTTTDSSITLEHEMDRLEVLLKKHEAGDVPRVDWLDNQTFRRIEQINKKHEAINHEHYLLVDLVQFDTPIVFSDVEYDVTSPFISTHQQLPAPLPGLAEAVEEGNVYTRVGAASNGNSVGSSLMAVYDPEQPRENLVEAKYRRLGRSHKSSHVDKELKPTAKIRDELNVIISFSPVQELTDDEKNLLWKFRYYLCRHKRALTKFLKSISWDDPMEARQAVEMLPRWAEIDVDDALELLGPTFKDSNVRSYAVDRLRKASDSELELYLLQLVEALKFEPPPRRHSVGGTPGSNVKTHLARFLIGRASRNPLLGNFFYWYVAVEAQEHGELSAAVYKPILGQFLKALDNQTSGPQLTENLKAQIKLMGKLLDLARTVRNGKESRPKKLDRLRGYLADSRNGLVSFAPVALPLDPTVKVVGCVPDESHVFKSSLSPIKVTLLTDNGDQYPIILKSGDDLRQDQLVTQIITLMDRLLLNENYDLKLTPYKILATGTKDGALQFIPNQTLSHVLAEYHGIIPYLRSHHPDDLDPLGIKPEVMDTFIRSCAGYCVITYILGVGDRHLENLLICPDGHFFHADFGYILGRDPKPFPPMMKLPIQIIEGMGGASSENYDKFRNYCFTAYTTLRKSANLILNLFALMTHSSIPDIMFERDKAVYKVKEKFCLEMTEAEAMQHFQNLINDSVNAFLPMWIDRLHSLAQYWRA